MDFSFSEDQLAFRDAVHDLLAKECPPEVVRAAWPDGPDSAGARPGEGARGAAASVGDVWQALAEMGVLGIAVPEGLGGLGLTEVDWVLLAEETGYVALPHPFVETVGVVGPMLAAVGDPQHLLPRVIDATGSVTASSTVGCSPSAGEVLLPWGDRGGTAFVIGFDDLPGSEQAWHARRSFDRIEHDASPARLLVPSLDGARHLVDLDSTLDPIGSPDDAQRAFDRGALGLAAQLVGLGRRMLDMTVAYVCERRQFGVPIGSQQAVKHHLADAALQLHFAAPAVYRAAWSLTAGADTAHRDVSMAKAMASDAARLVGRKALQCHGAIGYTVEYDLHLYLKRAEALARCWGDAAWHRRRVADALGI